MDNAHHLLADDDPFGNSVLLREGSPAEVAELSAS